MSSSAFSYALLACPICGRQGCPGTASRARKRQRPDLTDAETVLAIHDLCVRWAGLPPTLEELGEHLQRSTERAWQRAKRAARHGWLRKLPRGTRCYVPPWYGRMDWVLMREAARVQSARCPACGGIEEARAA